MRLEHPTLDGLSRQEFTEAMYAALAATLDAGPEESEALAATFGRARQLHREVGRKVSMLGIGRPLHVDHGPLV